MNSQKIIDYVMNTPNNTNPAILRQMLDENNSGGGVDNSKLDALIDRNITEINSNAMNIGQSAVSYCSSLTTVNFPVATSIGSSAFAYCTSLTTANFPAVTSIGVNAFTYCSSLTTADFHSTTTIDRAAFNGCSSLTAVILRSETLCSLLNSSIFTKCHHILGTVDSTYNPEGLKDGYIYVPSALVETYQNAPYWAALSIQFRALEDYTVDGTITGELDLNKI